MHVSSNSLLLVQCITLLRASAAAWNIECARACVYVYSSTLRNYSYAYLELRRALKVRILIGQNSARRDRDI